eukprot:TRINITY_DN22720_c0_g1_i2.p1 TRINITY_DN22720_c0_g1~~TRINITY_DN22720_c0_g1_i2.p1  ORF type:complete len:259 (+),score=70.11 TRINITY_DN22720_c0_g1_i2:145-921(+)
MTHYKRSLMASPTGEAWKSLGVCCYRKAKLQKTAKSRDRLLKEAQRYLAEANFLDKERPQINAWLVMCAVELGESQVAKQVLRQTLRFEDRLDTPTALELANVLLRFSDEQRAAEWGGERGRLVQDGRYAREAATVARIVLARKESGQARHVVARALALSGEEGSAAAEFCAALPLLATEDATALQEAAHMARLCASKLPGESRLAALVEEAIQVALEQQLNQGAAFTPQEGMPMDQTTLNTADLDPPMSRPVSAGEQ